MLRGHAETIDSKMLLEASSFSDDRPDRLLPGKVKFGNAVSQHLQQQSCYLQADFKCQVTKVIRGQKRTAVLGDFVLDVLVYCPDGQTPGVLLLPMNSAMKPGGEQNFGFPELAAAPCSGRRPPAAGFDVIAHLVGLSEPTALESRIRAEQVTTYGVTIWGHLDGRPPDRSGPSFARSHIARPAAAFAVADGWAPRREALGRAVCPLRGAGGGAGNQDGEGPRVVLDFGPQWAGGGQSPACLLRSKPRNPTRRQAAGLTRISGRHALR
ncbi:hypothetical protein CB1_000968018 [Camelus ferus]|nr:hypothetical protein CB1_000968018 [Camelus ferus]